MKILSASKPAETGRSFNAETMHEPVTQPRPADLSAEDLAKAVSNLKLWYTSQAPTSALADATSLYTGKQLDEMPENFATIIAGFCLNKFSAMRDQVGEATWQDWVARSQA